MVRPTRAGGTFAIAIAATLAHTPSSAAVSYCADLKRVVGVALTEGRFSSIAGATSEGSFSKTTAPLTDWHDCVIYGATTYTCDSPSLQSAQDAEKRQAEIIDDILSCFAGSWLHVLHRSSPGYAVLHPAKGAVSITLSIDEPDDKRFVVRLSLFVRRG